MSLGFLKISTKILIKDSSPEAALKLEYGSLKAEVNYRSNAIKPIPNLNKIFSNI
jgi:hypothetical protein